MAVSDRLPPDEQLTMATGRLDLLPLTTPDADDLFPVLRDQARHEFIGGAPPTLEELRKRFSSWQRRLSPDGDELWLNWTVRLVDGHTAVGYVQATVRKDEAIVAYVIGSRWSGLGLATEAVGTMCTLLRTRLDVARIVAYIHPQRIASSRVARHVGLRPTGTLDDDGEEQWMWTATPPSPQGV